MKLTFQLRIRKNERRVRLIPDKRFYLKWGMFLVVQTNRGYECGTVVYANSIKRKRRSNITVKKIVRIANQEDIKTLTDLDDIEKDYHNVCYKKINEKGIKVSLRRVELIFDKSKLLVYYQSDGNKKQKEKDRDKANMSAVIKELSRELKINVEAKEVTLRESAKVLGGIGTCGRMLCCSSYLSEIKSVTARMAKDQGISMNPKNLCGLCEKLKCCLRYELDNK
jgi:cell fate regulator YaaT (PSP1 superfamily)